jgi:hypothetical protein
LSPADHRHHEATPSAAFPLKAQAVPSSSSSHHRLAITVLCREEPSSSNQRAHLLRSPSRIRALPSSLSHSL